MPLDPNDPRNARLIALKKDAALRTEIQSMKPIFRLENNEDTGGMANAESFRASDLAGTVYVIT